MVQSQHRRPVQRRPDECTDAVDDPRQVGGRNAGQEMPERQRVARARLRERRGELRQVVTQWTVQHRFVVDDVLSGMIHRCRELGLRLAYDDQATGEGAAVLLTLHTSRIQRMRHREYFR